MLDNENNSSELSNEPITQDAGIEAIMGMVNPKEDLGEIENEPVAEVESEEYSEDETEETLDQIEDDDSDESDLAEDYSGEIELDPDDYEYLVSAKEFLNKNGLDDIKKIENGILMQGDYTRKTQTLSEERKAFEEQRNSTLEETAKMLETAQAMILGQKPELSTQKLIELKQTDPYSYEKALEAKVIYEQRQEEITAAQNQVALQYQEQLKEAEKQTSIEQAAKLMELEPSFSNQTTAVKNVEVISDYFESIGGDTEMLNSINDALVLKVLYDAATANKAQKQVAKVKAPAKKKASKTVLRKGVSSSRAEKQAAANSKKLKNATNSDGSFSQQAAVDLILDSFK